MKMRIIFFALMLTTMLFYRPNLSAQIKYESGKLTIGNVAPYSFYSVTAAVTGMYINTSNGRFFKLIVQQMEPLV